MLIYQLVTLNVNCMSVEDVMVDLMGYVFLVWLFPVIFQIVLPLCMLTGWLAVQLFHALSRNYVKPATDDNSGFSLANVHQKN